MIHRRDCTWTSLIGKKNETRRGYKILHNHFNDEVRHLGHPCFKSLCERCPLELSFRNIWFTFILRNLKTRRFRDPFYDPFCRAFKSYRSFVLFQPNVWLWIVEQERSTSFVQLYTSTMNLQYHSLYVPVKTEGIIVVQECEGGEASGSYAILILDKNIFTN